MNKPYIICHMMTSVDGRIDCGMTAKLLVLTNIMKHFLCCIHLLPLVAG